jgi:hypothetical protein
VSGTFAAIAPLCGMESSFCKAGNGAAEFSHTCCHSGEDLGCKRTIQRVLPDRCHGHSPLGQGECGGFVAKGDIGQRKIADEAIIFRLFFEERFQFAACLCPTLPGRGMVARDVLGPSLENIVARHWHTPALDQSW